jgi:hypothetical protein
LLALYDGVVFRINDLQTHSQTTRSFLGSEGLLDLVVVVVGRKGEHEVQFFHGRPVPESYA